MPLAVNFGRRGVRISVAGLSYSSPCFWSMSGKYLVPWHRISVPLLLFDFLEGSRLLVAQSFWGWWQTCGRQTISNTLWLCRPLLCRWGLDRPSFWSFHPASFELALELLDSVYQAGFPLPGIEFLLLLRRLLAAAVTFECFFSVSVR